MKYSIKLSGILLAVGFLAACNGLSTLNCNPDDQDFQQTALDREPKRMDQIWDTRDVDMDAHCEKDNPALIMSAFIGRSRNVKWLLEKGADPNIKSKGPSIKIQRAPEDFGKYDYGFCRRGDTALIAAARGEHVTVVDMLLRGHANYDLQNDNSGDTALHVAARVGNYAIVSSLIRAGVDINLQNKEGNTALHLAVKYSYNKIADLLIKRGADADITNKRSLNGNGEYLESEVFGIFGFKEVHARILEPPETLRNRNKHKIRDSGSYTAHQWEVSKFNIRCVGEVSTAPEGRTTPPSGNPLPDNRHQPVNVTVPITNNVPPPNNVQHNNNHQTVNVTVPPSDNNFNATVNPIFHAPQPEGTNDEAKCCSSFLKCLGCLIPALAL